MLLFDTHVHLLDEQFGDRQDEIIARAAAAGVTRLLCVSVTAANSAAAVALAARCPSVWAAVGVHPNDCGAAAPGDWDEVTRLAALPRVAALGETGLDRHWDTTPWPTQQDYFDRHLRLGQRLGLPCVIHMRDCGDEMLPMLLEARRRGPLRGVMHSFTGDAALARACLDLGLHLGFAGMVTFKKADDLRAIAASAPADRLLIETDAPYLAPHPHRGRRPNEPALLVHTAECLANTRGVSLAELAALTTANALALLTRAA